GGVHGLRLRPGARSRRPSPLRVSRLEASSRRGRPLPAAVRSRIMKFSLAWIDDFVDTSAAGGPEGTRRALEQAGFPLESLELRGSDAILDAEITPNRPDAMNHRGLAREIGAMTGQPMRSTPLEEPSSDGTPVDQLASVSIEVPRHCRRFGARVIRGISSSPAIELVRSRLSAIGAKSISAAVDATNYVLSGLA